MKYSVTVNDEWQGEMEYLELVDVILDAGDGDKIEIEVIVQ
jgi:hypothetical protein